MLFAQLAGEVGLPSWPTLPSAIFKRGKFFVISSREPWPSDRGRSVISAAGKYLAKRLRTPGVWPMSPMLTLCYELGRRMRGARFVSAPRCAVASAAAAVEARKRGWFTGVSRIMADPLGGHPRRTLNPIARPRAGTHPWDVQFMRSRRSNCDWDRAVVHRGRRPGAP